MFPLRHEFGMLLTYFLVSFFVGGIRGANRDPDKPLRAIILYSLSCGVAGLVTGLGCLHFMGMNQPYLQLLLVILAGWVGPAIVDRVAAVVTDRIGGQFNASGKPPTSPPTVEAARQKDP
jgi:biotin transporter BioY